jgi:hypothetical protein
MIAMRCIRNSFAGALMVLVLLTPPRIAAQSTTLQSDAQWLMTLIATWTPTQVAFFGSMSRSNQLKVLQDVLYLHQHPDIGVELASNRPFDECRGNSFDKQTLVQYWVLHFNQRKHVEMGFSVGEMNFLLRNLPDVWRAVSLVEWKRDEDFRKAKAHDEYLKGGCPQVPLQGGVTGVYTAEMYSKLFPSEPAAAQGGINGVFVAPPVSLVGPWVDDEPSPQPSANPLHLTPIDRAYMPKGVIEWKEEQVRGYQELMPDRPEKPDHDGRAEKGSGSSGSEHQPHEPSHP